MLLSVLRKLGLPLTVGTELVIVFASNGDVIGYDINDEGTICFSLPLTILILSRCLQYEGL